MKRIIDGKKYDTETAACIATWDNGYYGNDFKRCEESLYRTKKSLSDEQARQWLEEKDFTNELEEHFRDDMEEA